MPEINKRTTVANLAALVSTALESHGIEAVLSGISAGAQTSLEPSTEQRLSASTIALSGSRKSNSRY